MRERGKISTGTDSSFLWDIWKAGGWEKRRPWLRQEFFIPASLALTLRPTNPKGSSITNGTDTQGKTIPQA